MNILNDDTKNYIINLLDPESAKVMREVCQEFNQKIQWSQRNIKSFLTTFFTYFPSMNNEFTEALKSRVKTIFTAIQDRTITFSPLLFEIRGRHLQRLTHYINEKTQPNIHLHLILENVNDAQEADQSQNIGILSCVNSLELNESHLAIRPTTSLHKKLRKVMASPLVSILRKAANVQKLIFCNTEINWKHLYFNVKQQIPSLKEIHMKCVFNLACTSKTHDLLSFFPNLEMTLPLALSQ